MPQTLSNAPPRIRGGALSFLSLFTSLGTLLCCALPSLFVLFGLGATVATVLSDVPWLVTLSQHKHWVFIVAGVADCRRFRLRLCRRSTAADEKRCVRTERPDRVPGGQSIQPDRSLVFGRVVSSGVFHRVLVGALAGTIRSLKQSFQGAEPTRRSFFIIVRRRVDQQVATVNVP